MSTRRVVPCVAGEGVFYDQCVLLQNSFSFHQGRKQKQRKIRTLPTTQEDSTHGHHQMVNTKTRLIITFVAKDGEALYSQQKQDWELTVAQIMNSLLPNSDLN